MFSISGTLSLRCKRIGAKFAVPRRLIKNRRLQIALHGKTYIMSGNWVLVIL